MHMADLSAILQAGSKQWYAVIVSEFGGLHHFLSQYPHEFSYFQRYNGLFVSITSPIQSQHPFHNQGYDK